MKCGFYRTYFFAAYREVQFAHRSFYNTPDKQGS
jgi:hypothetical protein